MNALRKSLLTVLASVAGFSLLVSIADAATKRVSCSSSKTLNSAIAKLKPGDTLLVSGTCNENAVVPANVNNVVIDGQGQTTIDGGSEGATLTIRGIDVWVQNLTVTGGQTGIQIHRSSSATVDNVIVNGVGGTGIAVRGSSTARIVNSTIQNSGNNGVSVTENSNARIGFLTNNDTTVSPNTIMGNTGRGITVTESSNATIIGNNVSNNGNDGILVNAVSHADIASNTIDGNTGHGINFGRNSGVNLGTDSGSGIFDTPNSTTANNGGFGLRCFINSYADGRLGTLNGASGQTDFGSGCINSTIP
jgi:parallel beta-helix repeat protein